MITCSTAATTFPHDPAHEAAVQDLDRRLALIAGQVGGLRRMLTQERACDDVLIQLRSVVHALDAVRIRVAATGICGGADAPDFSERVSATERLLRMTR